MDDDFLNFFSPFNSLDEVMAVLKLDNNKVVGQTSWKPCSQSAWDQR